jgi:hypothetical protein
MGRMKEVFIATVQETEGLSKNELVNLARQKTRELGETHELYEFLTESELVNLIGEKNVSITSKEKK